MITWRVIALVIGFVLGWLILTVALQGCTTLYSDKKEIEETKITLGGGLFCPGSIEWSRTEEIDNPKK